MRSVLIDDSFRPWAAAGITAFLADEDVFLALQAQPGAQKTGQPARQASGQSSGLAFGQSPDRPVSSQYRQHGPVGHPPPAPLPNAPGSAVPQQARQQSGQQSGQRPGQIASSALPAAFASRFASLAPAPVLWTYAHLGADLAGQGSPERSAFLRSVIQNLHLPKGTSVFWPFAFPENTEGSGTTEQGYAAFRQGVAVVNPKLLIFIGNDSLVPMQGQIDLHLPFTQQLFQGRIHLLLPDFAALLEAPSLFDQTNSFLRAMLTAHGVIPGGR